MYFTLIVLHSPAYWPEIKRNNITQESFKQQFQAQTLQTHFTYFTVPHYPSLGLFLSDLISKLMFTR